MRKLITVATMAAALAVPSLASADKPANPGCFGQDRAAYLHDNFQSGGPLDTAPGASEWGAIAGQRAGDNGAINQAYKASCGG